VSLAALTVEPVVRSSFARVATATWTMTDDQAYYSAMEVETRGPSSRVIVASFLPAETTRDRSLSGRQAVHADWPPAPRHDGRCPVGFGPERLGKQSGADYLPEGDDVAERRREGRHEAKSATRCPWSLSVILGSVARSSTHPSPLQCLSSQQLIKEQHHSSNP